MARGYRFGVVGSISTVPDGSTVLPINDIDLLLQCAGVKNSQITTLAQLFSDVTTLQKVINSNNAIDYLVRSTEFAKQEALVPKMTSYTTPSGEVIYSSEYNTNSKGWYAFDDTLNAWQGSSTTNQWVGYHFTEPVKLYKFTLSPRIGGAGPSRQLKNYKIEGSNDGTNYTELFAGTIESGSSSIEVSSVLTNTGTYSYARVYGVDSYANVQIGVTELQFYTEEGFTDNATAMQLIGANNYASNTLLDDSTWLNAICNSTYFESVLNVKVPTMTSATTPEGVVTAIGSQSGYEAYKAFDNNTSTSWYIGSQSSTPWIQYQFTSAKRIYKAVVDVPSSSAGKTFTVQFFGSNDGTTFTELSSAYSYPTSNNGIHEDILEGTSYQYLRCNCKRNDANAGSVEELQFYGRVDV